MSAKRPAVSPNNPCPFLRALVAHGKLPDDRVPLGQLAESIVDTAKRGDGAPALPSGPVKVIGCVANGLGPVSLVRNAAAGVRLNQLRGGPLDKKGSGSRILDARGQVVEAELNRLAEFAGDKVDASGRTEAGLDAQDLKRMMDANFERAQGQRRRIDRRLMDGEWPILLKVMGKEGRNGRYLSLSEVGQLFRERRLPDRMSAAPGR